MQGTSLLRHEYGNQEQELIPQRPSEFAPDDAYALARFEVEAETTVDLPNENTVDLSPSGADGRSDANDSAALLEVETALTVGLHSNNANDASAAVAPTADARSLAPMPNHRALGFFAFAASALVAVLVTTQRPDESSPSADEVVMAAAPPGSDIGMRPDGAGDVPSASHQVPRNAEIQATQSAQPKPKDSGADTSLGVVSFASRSIVTSEQSVSAVFILKRTSGTKGRAAVRWSARSGDADAGIDFSDASGTARFADGQRQLAIYVPLRNDLLTEEDEIFKVCLRSPRQVRIGGRSCAEATILDDDDTGPT